MQVIEELLRGVPLPRVVPVRQRFADIRVDNLALSVRQAVEEGQVATRIQPDTEVAIGVGSRGIAGLPELVKAVVEVVKSRGARPFIVPAMGSHGGGTAEGQRDMLEHLGVTEAFVGAPIRATMEVVQLGLSATGLPLYVDKYAAAADGIIVINRIKPHTSFRGPVESGLIKMLVIGLGKQRGADTAHALGMEHMAHHLLDLSDAFLERLPFLFGVGVLENAYDVTAKVVALPAEQLREEEARLLQEARRWMPRILFDALDVLVVDEIGKDISGTGMDPNVTGRSSNNLVKGDLSVNRIAVLRLTDRADGNAHGIGLADTTTADVEASLDRVKGYMNAITSLSMAASKIPIVLPNEELAIKACVKTCMAPDLSRIRLVRIQNTLKLEHIWISEAMLPEAEAHANVEVLGPARPMRFDSAGRVLDEPHDALPK